PSRSYTHVMRCSASGRRKANGNTSSPELSLPAWRPRVVPPRPKQLSCNSAPSLPIATLRLMVASAITSTPGDGDDELASGLCGVCVADFDLSDPHPADSDTSSMANAM